MGNFDDKNIILKIEIRENLTDPRYTEYINQRAWHFTREDFIRFNNSIKENIWNNTSAKIIQFIMEYQNGLLLPDRCGTFEPLRKNFNRESFKEYVGWLSFPGGCLYLKKKRKLNISIENRTFALIWDENWMQVAPKAKLPEYLGEIIFFFAKQRKIDMDFLKQLLRDFCEYLQTDTDRAYIYDMENNREIIFDLFHPENVGKKYWKDCYSW